MDNDNKDLENNLNLTIIDLVAGLNNVATKLREGASQDDLADAFTALAGDVCKHWPECLIAQPKDSDYCEDSAAT